MDWFQVVLAALVINSIRGLSLKCGEEIIVYRGEKKVFRFWSSDDELLNVDIISKTSGGGDDDDAGEGVGSGGAGSYDPGTNNDPGNYNNQESSLQFGNKKNTAANNGGTTEFYYGYGARLTTESSGAAPALGPVGETLPHQQHITSTQVRDQGVPPQQQQQGHDSQGGSQHDGHGVNTVFSDDSTIYDFKTRNDYNDYDTDHYNAGANTMTDGNPSLGVIHHEDDTQTTTPAPPTLQEDTLYHTHESETDRIDETLQEPHLASTDDEDEGAEEHTTLGPQRPEQASVEPTSAVVTHGAAGSLEQDNIQTVATQGWRVQVKTPHQEQQSAASGVFTDDAESTTGITVEVMAQDATNTPTLQDKQTIDETTPVHQIKMPTSVAEILTTEAEPYTDSNAQHVDDDTKDWSAADQQATAEDSDIFTEAGVEDETQTVAEDDFTKEQNNMFKEREPVITSVTGADSKPVTLMPQTDPEGNTERLEDTADTLPPGHIKNEVHLADGLDETTASDDDAYTYVTTEPEYDVTQTPQVGAAHHSTEPASGHAQTESVTELPDSATEVPSTIEVPVTKKAAAATELPDATEVPLATEVPTVPVIPDTEAPQNVREEQTTGESVTTDSTPADDNGVTDLSQQHIFGLWDEDPESSDIGGTEEQVRDEYPGDTRQEVLTATTEEPSTDPTHAIGVTKAETPTDIRDDSEDIQEDFTDINEVAVDTTGESTTEAVITDSRGEVMDITEAEADTTEATTDITEIPEDTTQTFTNIREESPTDIKRKPVSHTTEEGAILDTTEATVDTTDTTNDVKQDAGDAKLDNMQAGGHRVEVTADDINKYELDGYGDPEDIFDFSTSQDEKGGARDDVHISGEGNNEITTTSSIAEPDAGVKLEVKTSTSHPTDTDEGLADAELTADNIYYTDSLHYSDMSDDGAGVTDTTEQAVEQDFDEIQSLEFDSFTTQAAADSASLRDATAADDETTQATMTDASVGDPGVGGSGTASDDNNDTSTGLVTTVASSDTGHDSHEDIFDRIIERLTENLERLPDEPPEPVDNFFLDFHSLLREEPTTADEEGTDGSDASSASQLTPGHRETASLLRNDATTDAEVTTEADVSSHTLAPGSFAMGGFMDLSMAAMFEDTPHTTMEPTEVPSEALAVALSEYHTEEALTQAPDYEYPKITDDDSFKGYDYYEDLVDSLTAKDRPYKDEGEKVRQTTGGAAPDEASKTAPDEASKTAPDEALTTDIPTMPSDSDNNASPDQNEENQDTVTTAQPDPNTTDAADEGESATTTGSPGTELYALEEPEATTTAPAEDYDVTALPDTDGDATTAFSIPLMILRNQVLNNLNTQAMKGDSKVVITEQGSKVAINHPAHHKHDTDLQNTSEKDSALVSTSTAELPETSAPTTAQDDTLQPNAADPDVAEEGTAGEVVRTPETHDKNETPTPSSSADEGGEQPTTTPLPTTEAVDDTTTPSPSPEAKRTTEDPELATILIPYSFVQYLGHASREQDSARHPGAQDEKLRPEHSGQQGPVYGSEDSPAYSAIRDEESPMHDEGSSTAGDESPVHGGEASPVYGESSSVNGEENPDYGEGGSVDSEVSPLHGGEVKPVYGEEYGETKPEYDKEHEGEVKPVYGEESPGYGGEESPGYGGEESPEYGGEESPGYGGEESPGYNDEESPGYGGDESPGYSDEESPGYSDVASPVYDESPVHSEKDTKYGEPKPVNGENSPVYGEASPDYREENPVYGEETSLQGEENLGYGEASLVYDEVSPDYGKESPQQDGSLQDGQSPLHDGEESLVYSETLANGEQGPVYGDEASPVYGEQSPVYGEENPVYGDEARPVYGEQSPVYGDQARPVYGEGSPVYSEARPVYGEASPVYGEARPVYGKESPVYGEARPAYSEESPVYGEESAAYGDETRPVYGEQSPVYVELNPVYSEKSPVYGERIPVYGDEARPVYGENAAYGEEARPVHGSEGRPVYGDEARPVYDEARPVYGEARPVYGDERPVYREESVAYGDEVSPVYGGEGRPVHDNGQPVYGGVERPAYGGSGRPVSGGGSLGPGALSRKDDSGVTDYGGDSPFFIKLPGSPNAVPVFLQYEPVQVKYISEQLEGNVQDTASAQNFGGVKDDAMRLQERIDTVGSVEAVVKSSVTAPQGEAPQFHEGASDLKENMAQGQPSPSSGDGSLSASLMDGIYRILDNVAVAANNRFSEQQVHKQGDTDNFIPHQPIGERPDPFFLMDAPQLGEHNTSHSHQPPQLPTNDTHVSDHHNKDSYSVDVSGKLDFEGGKPEPEKETAGTVEDVPLGMKQEILYPGDYYTHHLYAGLNLSSLINPVFDLSTQPTTQSQEERMNPQYTPFPITTNPPRHKASRPVDTPLDPESTPTQDTYTLSGVSSTTSTETPMHLTSSESPVTKSLPSVEYSSIPTANFEDSFDASYIPEYFYENENRIQPADQIPPHENQVFHGSVYQENEGVPPATTGQVSAAPYKTSDDAVLTQASLTRSTVTSQDATESTTADPTAATDGTTASISNLPPPPDQFTAHQQVWAFPQSREEPGGPELDDPSRIYSAFYSPREIPGIDPSIFGYRKVPQAHGESSAPVYTYDLPQPQEEASGGAVPSASAGGPNADPAHHALLGPQFFKYLNSLPYALLRKFLDPTTAPAPQERLRRAALTHSGKQVLCEWNIKTEPGLYMLMTFHNLSAPYTVDCHGAYIEVERENNGYDARWCGNRMYQAGTRPHVIFAKTEVRINVFDDGDTSKSLPTGFEADIEVIDLFDADDYNAFMKSNAYPHIRRLLLG